MEICKKDKCTGCYACVNACSHNCITMAEDEFGKVVPLINEKSCIGCNLCIKSCPNNIKLEYNHPLHCYASWITNKSKRKICASGGIGTIMSEYVIKNNGIVFGSRYNNDMTPIMSYAQTIDELEKFKGSRYVQSLVGNETLKQVRKFLKNGRLVLFIGTPCQIAGLKTFLRSDYDNLITVDLICHGVCPTKYFKEEISMLSQKYKLKDISDIRFRGNDGNNFNLTIWGKNGKKLFPKNNLYERILHLNDLNQYYITGFLLGISLRENCYTCNYARPERIADITIGDFIGLGKNIPFNHPNKNISSVLINTAKGEIFYNKVSINSNELENIERDYSERLEYAPSLKYPYPRHKLNTLFYKYYLDMGYIPSIQKTLKKHLYKKVSYRIIRLPLNGIRKIEKTLTNKIKK